MVEAGGVEPRAIVEPAQVIDNMKRLKRQKRSIRPIWLRSGYAELLGEARGLARYEDDFWEKFLVCEGCPS